mmetsp:Transcript_33190/g.93020  ORF Transcript_33190/g.93020 Transcript_33190/m.93020 type:complete len:648 (+) Transcript_33190:128-2071(+)
MANKLKLERLRAVMGKHALSGYIVPAADPHQSEYVAPFAQRRAYISEFTGSAGTTVVTRDHAALWTDGRYFIQANIQLDADSWTLMKQGVENTPSITDWLKDVIPEGGKIGFDAELLSGREVQRFEAGLSGSKLELVSVTPNLIDEVWDDKPAVPHGNVVVHTEFAGRSATDKLKDVRHHMDSHGAEVLVAAALDEVAWLLNVRGRDIACTPVVISYVVVTKEECVWFVDSSKLNEEVSTHVKEGGVTVYPYEDVFKFLSSFKYASQTPVALLHDVRCSQALFEATKENVAKPEIKQSNFITEQKGVKTEVEIEGMRQCHRRDAAALMRYFCWLEGELGNGAILTEHEAAEQLAKYRFALDKIVSLSFPTISSTGPNGAIIHYMPTAEEASVIIRDQLYLCDSGGQYHDGTTDITRTVHFGTPSDYEKKCFTLVLKGHIAVDKAVFPSGTTGFQIDLLARQHLWQHGLDYRHGTGHGVGAHLNVHEGPHSISSRASNVQPLLPGMTVTNEPGYYEEGAFGIRIENVLVVKEVIPADEKTNKKAFLGFENITCAPIQGSLVDLSLMTKVVFFWAFFHNVSPQVRSNKKYRQHFSQRGRNLTVPVLIQEEIRWLDEYNALCVDKLTPFLKDEPEVLAFVKKTATPLGSS